MYVTFDKLQCTDTLFKVKNNRLFKKYIEIQYYTII